MSDSDFSEGKLSDRSKSDDNYNSDIDAIRQPEISDSSMEEDNEENQEIDESFRVIDQSLIFYVFENIITKFFKHKKVAKEASKQMKLE